MLKLKNSAMLVVAALCGYLALMTPDWKADLVASGGGAAYSNDFGGGTPTLGAGWTSDILMLRPSTGENFIFPFTNGEAVGYNKAKLYPSTAWAVIATEDYDGDGDTDALMRNTSTGEWHVFTVADHAATGSAKISLFGNGALNWSYEAGGDFNGDGAEDVLLYDSTGDQYWGFTVEDAGAGIATTSNRKMTVFTGTYQLRAVGDFDGNGTDDMLMQNGTSTWWLFKTNSTGAIASNNQVTMWSGDYQYAATGDFNADGIDDILLRNNVTGAWRIFLFDGTGNVGSGGVNPGLYPDNDWQLRWVADLNNDGTTDVALGKVSNGEWQRFLMTAGSSSNTDKLALYAGTAWAVADVRDFDGDGTEDVILFNSAKSEYFTSGIAGGTVQYTTKSKIFPVDPSVWAVVD